jgi:hypothetical protein
MSQKNKILNAQMNIQNKGKNLMNKIIYIIIELQKIQIKNIFICCFRYHPEHTIDFIESLVSNMKDIGFNAEDHKKVINKIIKSLKSFIDEKKLSFEDLLTFEDSQSVMNSLHIDE